MRRRYHARLTIDRSVRALRGKHAGRWNTLKQRHYLEAELCETALMQHVDRRPDADASLANFADPSMLEDGESRKRNKKKANN
jgi:hypothetical protein